MKYRCNHADDCAIKKCNHHSSHDETKYCLVVPCKVMFGVHGSHCQVIRNVKVKCESIATCEKVGLCNHVQEHDRRPACRQACENPEGVDGSKCIGISKFEELPEELFDI